MFYRRYVLSLCIQSGIDVYKRQAGQLGHDVMIELRKRGHEGIGVDISEMDITNYSDVERVLMASKPDAVIHLSLIHI